MYTIPEEYAVRLHHVRPRFKGDIENVLIYVATEISKIPELPKDEFAEQVNSAIFRYPGNSIATKKTVDNWRTEISALFGFIEHNDGYDKCGLRAMELAKKGDLIECFKTFLYSFQYPAAHVKPQSVLELIENGIRFKPAQYILKLLKYATGIEEKRPYLTKPEICHCVFNDLRVSRDNDNPSITWERITKNRNAEIEYDTSGDVVRYAGDIADYMVIANILVTYDHKRYYLNTLEDEAIQKFINSTEWFSGYDKMINKRTGTLPEISSFSDDWFRYVNRSLEETDFTTDIIALLADDSVERTEAENESRKAFTELVKSDSEISTKDIGDFGESLVFAHECERLRQGDREDLVHLVKRIPTALAVGYDINSRELDDRQRHIEVKTTVSSRPLDFNKVHLTRNEWNAAETDRATYFVYRLMISKTVPRLFVLQDPVGKYKQDLINMVPTEGADLTFASTNTNVGFTEELLSWTK